MFSSACNRSAMALARGVFSPLQLFAGGEKGVWLDFSDLATMSQDSAGTTPVTAIGQTVNRVQDKSGNACHATSTAGPTLQQDSAGRFRLLFDGATQFLVTASVDLSAATKLTAFAAYEKSGTATQILFETSSALGVVAGAYGHIINDASPNEYMDFTQGGLATFLGKFANSSRAIVSHSADQSGASNAALLATRLNGAAMALTYTGGATTPSNFVNQQVYVGRRNGGALWFTGSMYGVILRAGITTASVIALNEQWMNARAGAY